MLRTFTLSFLILITSILSAQPVLTSANITPQIGDVFKTIRFYPDTAGGSGPNRIWDFSNIAATAGDTVEYTAVSVQSTSFASKFQNANVAIVDPDDYFRFLKSDNNSLIELGEAGDGESLLLSNSRELFRFPFTFGSTFTDTYSGSSSSGFFSASKNGKVVVTADAYGTLILPTGTFTDVIRVITIDSTVGTFSGFGINDTTRELISTSQWFKAGYRWPLLTISITVDDFGTFYDGNYLFTNNTVSSISDKNISPLVSYPNPCHDYITIDGFEDGKNEALLITVTDLNGSIVLQTEQQLTGRAQLNTDNIPSGMYILTATQGSNRYQSRFVKL